MKVIKTKLMLPRELALAPWELQHSPSRAGPPNLNPRVLEKERSPTVIISERSTAEQCLVGPYSDPLDSRAQTPDASALPHARVNIDPNPSLLPQGKYQDSHRGAVIFGYSYPYSTSAEGPPA
ncbi:hypothetical protein CCHR01_09335 [Colletotrichum chrysophilum]|uniref:Uncharacterized protein n=1 Tax=Colletotrichum chrysophilum TaxID=1836956 RepID=A0AAD9AI15_9PEZI|nr:hypothetical protein CCHR01_09335 [Colletotrichum chrysophilum]